MSFSKEIKEEICSVKEASEEEQKPATEEQQMAMVFRMLSKEQGAAVFAELESEEQEYISGTLSWDNKIETPWMSPRRFFSQY